ncbi:TonB-dependent receptor plug domain-containing protein [Akkermansiaceae bacterium]|nr:TonB-dependent receptor plug domain-containing protein [Akkermansiaceae bacterium]
MKTKFYAPILITIVTANLPAQEEPIGLLSTLVVKGKSDSLIGEAGTASFGTTNYEELRERPYLRRGELLEVVPGVIITQHSGDGKANQYFVRGFNLDHGTDFSIAMDGQPVNFVTHAHGQGYADLNPLIPELVESVDYWKGPFTGHLGDLSTAGGARFNFFDTLPQGIATLEVGEHKFFRGLIADTIDLSRSGDREGLTYAFEYNHYDGPWEREGNSQRINAFLKYFKESGRDSFSLTAMAYDAEWDSTDQIPRRLIESGGIGRLGNFDNSVRGDSSRYSLMGEWKRDETNGKTHADFYVGRYDLDLFSNFTYFLSDPANGDQFEQEDGRWFLGGEVNRMWEYGNGSTFTVGLQTRHDFMDGIGLYNTAATNRLGAVRVDDVYQGSAGIYAAADHSVNDWLRVQPSLRADGFHFDVDSDNPANSGAETDGIISPKLNLIFGPWADTEFYASAGFGFHSNDARGTTLSIDPVTGLPADPADPLVRTYGFELGARTEAVGNVVSALSIFYLHSDSELIYVGDAGAAEAGPATERFGIEWATYWKPNEWLTFDNELTLSEGRLLGVGGDDEIPGAVPITMSTGVTFGEDEGFYGTLRSRYFSPRPLVEDGSVESRASWQLNGRLGYRKDNWQIALDVLNILGRKDNDIEYFYESQLPGELAGVEDIHLHPAEPRTFRISFTRYF